MNTAFEFARRLIATFPWAPERAWVAISALVSGCAAVATVLLAWFTRKMAVATKELASETTQLARDTADAADRADEHHQQTLWPFVSLAAVERLTDNLGLSLRNIGTGVAVRGTASIISGHTKLNPMDTVEQFGPIAIGATTVVTLSRLSRIKTSEGLFPEWVTFRVTFESIFHSTGYTDWLFRMTTGELRPSAYVPPQILKRTTLDAIKTTL